MSQTCANKSIKEVKRKRNYTPSLAGISPRVSEVLVFYVYNCDLYLYLRVFYFLLLFISVRCSSFLLFIIFVSLCFLLPFETLMFFCFFLYKGKIESREYDS